MSVITYSKCHVGLKPNDDSDSDSDSDYESSNRSLIEIRDLDNQKYILRAIDLDNTNRVFKQISLKFNLSSNRFFYL